MVRRTAAVVLTRLARTFYLVVRNYAASSAAMHPGGLLAQLYAFYRSRAGE